MQDYGGGRDYDELLEFASKNLKPMCSVKNIGLCDEEQKSKIEKFLAMSVEDLTSAIEGEEKKIEDAQAKFEEEVQKLQEKFEELQAIAEQAGQDAKERGLGMIKDVLNSKKAVDGKDEL